MFAKTYVCDRCGAYWDFYPDDEQFDTCRLDEGCDGYLLLCRPDSPVPMWVNGYATERIRGGQEEGGWYYTAGEPVASVPVQGYYRRYEDGTVRAIPDPGQLEHATKMMVELFTRAGARFSDETEVRIEDHFARPFPTYRPRYE